MDQALTLSDRLREEGSGNLVGFLISTLLETALRETRRGTQVPLIFTHPSFLTQP